MRDAPTDWVKVPEYTLN